MLHFIFDLNSNVYHVWVTTRYGYATQLT